MYVKKEKNGAYYPRIGLVRTENGEVFGIPRWQGKKWKLADREIDDFDIGDASYSLEKEKISIPWKEWKTLEERFEKVVYVVLWMFHGTENEMDADAVASAVTALTHNEKFEIVVNEHGNGHLRYQRREDDSLGAFESFEYKMANDSEAVEEYCRLTKGEATSLASSSTQDDACDSDSEDKKDASDCWCDRIDDMLEVLKAVEDMRRF